MISDSDVDTRGVIGGRGDSGARLPRWRTCSVTPKSNSSNGIECAQFTNQEARLTPLLSCPPPLGLSALFHLIHGMASPCPETVRIGRMALCSDA